MTVPANRQSNYHAHLYFDETSMDRAIELRGMIYT